LASAKVVAMQDWAFGVRESAVNQLHVAGRADWPKIWAPSAFCILPSASSAPPPPDFSVQLSGFSPSPSSRNQ
jgi:hypothetical protein